jgi:hypothetical protein
MVASSDLPDVPLTDALTREQILDYGGKGALVPLNGPGLQTWLATARTAYSRSK